MIQVVIDVDDQHKMKKLTENLYFLKQFLANRIIGCWHYNVVWPSVRPSVHL